jgi:hypothetical protein
MQLAAYLDGWALRREKVLHLLDIDSAREARRLAVECRRLDGQIASRPDAWRSLKLRIVKFLGSRPSSQAGARPHGDG